MRLVLASGSPRRRELLERLGLEFTVEPAGTDETREPGEAPAVYVERVATAKAASVAGPERLVVAADTVVVHEGKVMGKPVHPEEARSMLRRLQGDRHEVFTALAVASWDGEVTVDTLVDLTEVVMTPMTDEEIADYVASGEPMDKAGAYALQGAGGRFVHAVHGSPFTVIGLPIHLLDRLIAHTGTEFRSFLGTTPGGQ